MLHRTAKLTPLGRQLLVDRILIEGSPRATRGRDARGEPCDRLQVDATVPGRRPGGCRRPFGATAPPAAGAGRARGSPHPDGEAAVAGRPAPTRTLVHIDVVKVMAIVGVAVTTDRPCIVYTKRAGLFPARRPRLMRRTWHPWSRPRSDPRRCRPRRSRWPTRQGRRAPRTAPPLSPRPAPADESCPA
jgi:hypothetical protein